MILRMLREPVTGKPGPLARMIAVLLLIGLVAATGPVLIAPLRWAAGLLMITSDPAPERTTP